MSPKIALLVKDEIYKLFDTRLIKPIYYSPWISNIVAITKLDNRIRMCMNFWDLHKSSLKNGFPPPNIDTIVDQMMGNSFLSFMDRFSWYNHIFINPQGQCKMLFTTIWRIFFWYIMDFGMKNVCATYQRAMWLIFHDYIQKYLEYYVNDIL
jgi:hypothetical protein